MLHSLEQRLPLNNDTSTDSKIKSKHNDVFALLEQGYSITEVAEKLNKGVGEISIIVSLLEKERNANNG